MGDARARLRARREEQGFSQERLAEAVGASVASVRDWEQGRRLPHPDTRPQIAQALEVTLPELALLLDQAVAPNGHAVPNWLGHLASLEQAAARIWAFEPVVVHGLLQTPEYATAVEGVGPSPVNPDHVAQKVGTRVARQAVLTRQPNPLRLSVVLDESVLYRVAGGGEVMAAQLAHLASVASLPDVTVQVLPLAAGVFCAAFGSFSAYASTDGPAPYMVVTEDRAGPHYLDRPPDVEAHVALWRYLSAVALPPSESLDLIRTTAEEKYR